MLTRELIKLIAVLSFLLGLSLVGSVHAHYPTQDLEARLFPNFIHN